MRNFNTQEEAEQWLLDYVEHIIGESCIDNLRFAYQDDEQQCATYRQAVLDGCCGSHDEPVRVGGRLASVGCNYGH